MSTSVELLLVCEPLVACILLWLACDTIPYILERIGLKRRHEQMRRDKYRAVEAGWNAIIRRESENHK